MKRQNSIGYNYIMNTLIQGSAYVLPLVVNPYVSRLLGPEGMGQISYVTAILYYFSMFAVLGAPNYGIREVAKAKENKRLLSETVYGIAVINLILGLFVYIIYFVFIQCAPLSSVYRKLLFAMSPAILLNLIGMEWLYKGLEKFSVIAVRNILIKFVAIVLIFVLVQDQKDIYLYGILTVIAAHGASLWNFLGHFSYVGLRDVKHLEIKKHIFPMLLFFGMTIATTIYTNLDMIMLGALHGDYAAGIYDAAVKIKIVAVAAVSSLGAVLLPRVTALVAKGKIEAFQRVSTKALHFILLFSISLSCYIGMNVKPLILIFSGEQFYEAALVLVILCPTFVLIGMTNIIGLQMLIPLGREKQLLISEIAGAGTDLILNLLLIPVYGAAGAAVGTLIAEFVVGIIQIYAGRDYVVGILCSISIYKLFAAGFLAGFPAWIGSRMMDSSWGKLICSAVIYCLVYGCIFVFSKRKRNGGLGE